MRRKDVVLDYRNLADQYILKAREQEQLADARKEQIRRKARSEAHNRLTPSERRSLSEEQFESYVDGITDGKCNGSRGTPPDPIWQGHVARNQWYIQQAIMYSTRANGTILTQILNVLTGVNTGKQIFSSAVSHGQESRW
jgi:hypothetical protein